MTSKKIKSFQSHSDEQDFYYDIKDDYSKDSEKFMEKLSELYDSLDIEDIFLNIGDIGYNIKIDNYIVRSDNIHSSTHNGSLHRFNDWNFKIAIYIRLDCNKTIIKDKGNSNEFLSNALDYAKFIQESNDNIKTIVHRLNHAGNLIQDEYYMNENVPCFMFRIVKDIDTDKLKDIYYKYISDNNIKKVSLSSNKKNVRNNGELLRRLGF